MKLEWGSALPRTTLTGGAHPLTMKNISSLQNPLKTQPPANMVIEENHYSRSTTNYRSSFSKKRKFEDQHQTLTLQRTSFRCRSWESNNHRYQRRYPRIDFNGRKWTHSDRDSSSFGGKFVLMSYNILGVRNVSQHPDLYFKVPFKYMKWDYRRAAICKEIAQYDASIICFQEVDRFGSLHYALKQYGFQGILKARTGDASDGCAIFWKHERFQLLHEDYIEFQSFGLRNNVAQFCVLKMIDDQLTSDPKMSKQCLVVGNIHILFNPKRGDIKLGQIRLFLERAHRISEEWGGIPIVLAGDFNSIPQSALYQYISSAKLNIIQHDRINISGQIGKPQNHSCFFNEPFRNWNGCEDPRKFRWNEEELKNATGNEKVTCLQHSLGLRSAYLGVPGNFTTRDNVGEPLATSYHSKFFGTVDYIWHSEQLVPLRVLETLSRDTLENMGGLPSKDWGSDHLALACEFAFANSDFNTCSKRIPTT